ncbi:MAG: hypothetical protein ABW051_02685, partial [Burkholderiaceae bacterium]
STVKPAGNTRVLQFLEVDNDILRTVDLRDEKKRVHSSYDPNSTQVQALKRLRTPADRRLARGVPKVPVDNPVRAQNSAGGGPRSTAQTRQARRSRVENESLIKKKQPPDKEHL